MKKVLIIGLAIVLVFGLATVGMAETVLQSQLIGDNVNFYQNITSPSMNTLLRVTPDDFSRGTVDNNIKTEFSYGSGTFYSNEVSTNGNFDVYQKVNINYLSWGDRTKMTNIVDLQGKYLRSSITALTGGVPTFTNSGVIVDQSVVAGLMYNNSAPSGQNQIYQTLGARGISESLNLRTYPAGSSPYDALNFNQGFMIRHYENDGSIGQTLRDQTIQSLAEIEVTNFQVDITRGIHIVESSYSANGTVDWGFSSDWSW